MEYRLMGTENVVNFGKMTDQGRRVLRRGRGLMTSHVKGCHGSPVVEGKQSKNSLKGVIVLGSIIEVESSEISSDDAHSVENVCRRGHGEYTERSFKIPYRKETPVERTRGVSRPKVF